MPNLSYPVALLVVRDKRIIVILSRQTLAADTQLALYHGQVGVSEYNLLPRQSLLVCGAGAVLIIRFHGTEGGVHALLPTGFEPSL